MVADPFSARSASERARALVDPGSLTLLGGGGAEDSVWTGRAALGGAPVLLALTDGRRRGGTVGIREAGILTALTSVAEDERPAAVIVCWDTGGVRVQEGPVALAATSAVGVALARLALQGMRLLTVISGPRGCFGAPSVVAGLSPDTILTSDAHWGLTGPQLLEDETAPVDEQAAREAISARHRRRTRLTDTIVPDSAAAIRDALLAALARPSTSPTLPDVLRRSAEKTRSLAARLRAEKPNAGATSVSSPSRDLLRYSFRGRWQAERTVARQGLVQAGWGRVDGRSALALIVGPATSGRGGIGLVDAAAIADAVRYATRQPGTRRAPIFVFLFCQGHSSAIGDERLGLPVALAHCLRSLIAAREMGHPLLCVLGGGAYGAAYLSLAAPCHRIIALRGTSVAPMAPHIFAAFKKLRGLRRDPDTPADLAELIPEVRMVESIIRLPAALSDELRDLRGTLRS